MIREWKDIPSFNGRYQASTDGLIRSIRVLENKMKNIKRTKTHIMRQGESWGYKNVAIRIGDAQKTYYTHRLIALTFINNENNKPYVNHINGNKMDNRVENLEWVTRSENAKHAIKIGLQKVFYGEQHPMAKLNEKIVKSIRAEYIPGVNGAWRIHKKYGISLTHCKDIINNKTWTHI